MNILVTGSTGFIGRSLIQKLYLDKRVTNLVGVARKNSTYPFRQLSNNEFLHEEFYCDITNEKSVKTLFECFQPDVIFHLAANPVVKENKENPCQISIDNYLGTHHLLAHCPKGIKFVFASTILVSVCDGDSNDYDTNKYFPSSVYGVTKAASELLVNNYYKLGKIQASILRLCANVGKNSTHGILHDFVRRIKNDDEKFDIIGDKPGSTKPYCYVEDTAKALILYGLNRSRDYDIANICPSNSISNERIAEILMNVIGIHKEINWLGEKANWKGDDREIYANNYKAMFRGWEPRFPTSELAVEQAIKDIFNGKV
jgi:UDP-glucose 4-epimerase